MDARTLIFGFAVVPGLMGIASQGNAACLRTSNSKSPDGQLTAPIAQTGHSACGEGQIEIVDRNNDILARSDYRSNDGRGLVIAKTAWTRIRAFS